MFLTFDQYRPNADELMGRVDACFADAVAKKPGHLLLRTLMPSDIALYENLKLNTFDFESEAGIDRYIAELCEQYHKSFAARQGVLDDAVPVVSPVLGIGDYSAFVAGDIAFAADTSWSKPLLAEVGDYKKLPPLGTSIWYKRFLLICDKLMTAMGTCGLPFTRGFFSPMDLAGALRGEGVMRLILGEDGKTIQRVEKIVNNVGRVREVTVGPDGSIYFTTSNRDGRADPREGDDRLFRIIPVFE